jgi:hypothetical protein
LNFIYFDCVCTILFGTILFGMFELIMLYENFHYIDVKKILKFANWGWRSGAPVWAHTLNQGAARAGAPRNSRTGVVAEHIFRDTSEDAPSESRLGSRIRTHRELQSQSEIKPSVTIVRAWNQHCTAIW